VRTTLKIPRREEIQNSGDHNNRVASMKQKLLLYSYNGSFFVMLAGSNERGVFVGKTKCNLNHNHNGIK